MEIKSYLSTYHICICIRKGTLELAREPDRNSNNIVAVYDDRVDNFHFFA